MAGVGQVITHPDFRGQGIMSALLSEATRRIDRGPYDASWLCGKRTRYARFGWGACGRTYQFTIGAEAFAGVAAPEAVRAFTAQEDLARIRKHIAGLNGAVLISDDELRQWVSGSEVCGWMGDDAFALLNKSRDAVLLADGDGPGLSSLFAHHFRTHSAEADKPAELQVEASSKQRELLGVCLQSCVSVNVRDAFGLRIGHLLPMMQKVVGSMDAGALAGSDSVCLTNTDSGESFRLEVGEGTVAVSPGSRRGSHELSGARIAELLFGLLPPHTYLPDLSPTSPLGRLLPLDVHIPKALRDVV
jgi:hypothetical protein